MTTPEQHRRVEELFHELCDLEPDEREPLLAELAEREPELATAVRALLSHHTVAEIRALHLQAPGEDDLIGQSVGPYRVERLLGAGGMGVVYAASQESPVRREVALKLLRSGSGSREVVARFESERQALALMNHPNIAQVYDAGTAPDGRPFFVMELVPGCSITEYCDTHRLDTSRRLDLFLKVCDAVHHAHQKGVIHRDLKPSNVIVTEVSGEAVPKVIDFGVAKATDRSLTENSLLTEIGQLIGTPEYMSPEQADMSHVDVDTRSDVYALGVLLYELLSGHSPFDLERLREAGLSAILREIREVEPPRPSTRIRTLDRKAHQAAESRQTQPGSLARTLDGDLDWIVLRAMEKDRERRYASVANLGDDIRRYLDDRPVVAGPPRLSYRARKFVRRNRALVAASVAVAVALLLGLAGTTLALLRALDAEGLAAEQRDTAEQRLRVAEEVSYFLVRLFESADPTLNDPAEVSVKKLLERGVERVDEDLADQPNVRADVLRTLGRVWANMGHLKKAQGLLERAVDIRGDLENQRLADVVGDLNELAILYRRIGENEKALETHRAAIDLLEEYGETGTLAHGTQLNGLGIVHMNRGEFAAAREALELAVEILAREGSNDELTTLTNVGIVRDRLGNHEGAVTALQSVLERRETLVGPDHPRLAPILNSLGNALVNADRRDEAAPIFDRALAIWTETLGPDHYNVARVYNNIGYMHQVADNPEAAIPPFTQALAIKEKIYGPDHTRIVSALTNLGTAYRSAGEFDSADLMFVRARSVAFNDERSSDGQRITCLSLLAGLRIDQQRPAEATEILAEAIALSESGADHERTVELKERLAELRQEARD